MTTVHRSPQSQISNNNQFLPGGCVFFSNPPLLYYKPPLAVEFTRLKETAICNDFILLQRTYSSSCGSTQRMERSDRRGWNVCAGNEMYASPESNRQLINSRLHLSKGSRLAYIWCTGALTRGIPTWNQLGLSLVRMSSLWGSLCCNRFLISGTLVFLSLLFISILQCSC